LELILKILDLQKKHQTFKQRMMTLAEQLFTNDDFQPKDKFYCLISDPDPKTKYTGSVVEPSFFFTGSRSKFLSLEPASAPATGSGSKTLHQTGLPGRYTFNSL